MGRLPLHHVMLFFVLSLILSACIQDTREPDPTAEAEAAIETIESVQASLSLTGTSWELESIGGPEDSIPANPNVRSTVNYMVDRYAGTGGCNWYRGVYSADETMLRMNTPAQTRLACVEPKGAMDQEGQFLSLLYNTVEYEIKDDQLIAYTVNKQQLMTLIPAEPVPFEGTTWSLKFILGNSDRMLTLIPGTTVTAIFEGEQVSGSGGCNDYSAGYQLQGDALSIDDLTATVAVCEEPDGTMEQETLFLTTLESVATFKQTGGVLELFDAEGEVVVSFGAQ